MLWEMLTMLGEEKFKILVLQVISEKLKPFAQVMVEIHEPIGANSCGLN